MCVKWVGGGEREREIWGGLEPTHLELFEAINLFHDERCFYEMKVACGVGGRKTTGEAKEVQRCRLPGDV